MRGWATVAWLAGLVAVLAAAWMEGRSRRSGADAPAGSRVARHRSTYARPWLQVLLGMTLIGNAASMATHDPAGHDRRIGTAVMILGVVTVVVGATGLLRQHRWNRRQGRGTVGAPPPDRRA